MEHQGRSAEQEPSLEEKLRTRQQLSLDHTDVQELTACHRCPELEDLRIRTAAVDRPLHELQTAVETDTVIHYMEHPSMKEMVLWDMRVVVREEKSPSGYPPIEMLN